MRPWKVTGRMKRSLSGTAWTAFAIVSVEQAVSNCWLNRPREPGASELAKERAASGNDPCLRSAWPSPVACAVAARGGGVGAGRGVGSGVGAGVAAVGRGVGAGAGVGVATATGAGVGVATGKAV